MAPGPLSRRDATLAICSHSTTARLERGFRHRPCRAGAPRNCRRLHLSGLPAWLSDALCRLVERLSRRASIDPPRSGTGNGSMPARRWKRTGGLLESARPRMLGALLDAAVRGLQTLPDIRLTSLPRMADFALWATACETALWPAGSFAEAVLAKRNTRDQPAAAKTSSVRPESELGAGNEYEVAKTDGSSQGIIASNTATTIWKASASPQIGLCGFRPKRHTQERLHHSRPRRREIRSESLRMRRFS